MELITIFVIEPQFIVENGFIVISNSKIKNLLCNLRDNCVFVSIFFFLPVVILVSFILCIDLRVRKRERWFRICLWILLTKPVSVLAVVALRHVKCEKIVVDRRYCAWIKCAVPVGLWISLLVLFFGFCLLLLLHASLS